MSEHTSGPSAEGDSKAGAPREPTEIVVFRNAAQGDASDDWRASHHDFAAAPAAPAARSGWGSRIVALVAVAALVGAVGGSLAATGLGHVIGKEAPAAAAVASADELKSAREAITRLESQVAALKADADKTSKTRSAQIGKLGERLDKAEKAHDDTAGRLAKLAEAQDKDRKAAADVTGSVPRAAAKASSGPQVVEGWRLNRIVRGGAEVEFDGVRYAVYPGDPLPGVGTVSGLKRIEDGRWALVTSKGLIIGR